MIVARDIARDIAVARTEVGESYAWYGGIWHERMMI
jgi:hypothetical protein